MTEKKKKSLYGITIRVFVGNKKNDYKEIDLLVTATSFKSAKNNANLMARQLEGNTVKRVEAQNPENDNA